MTACLMSKMRKNLIKIRSRAIFSWFRFSSYFKVDKRLRFRLVSFKLVCDLESLRRNETVRKSYFLLLWLS